MRTHLLALSAAALLAACGSGDDYSAPPPAPAPAPAPADPPISGSMVPTSATTSSTGATAFVRTSSTSSSDSAAPIELGDAQLAATDTGEPEDL